MDAPFPRAICRKAWELGLMNTHIPGAYGGPGLGVLDGCLVAEEVAWGCTGVGTAIEANTLAEAPIIVGGSDEQKQRFLAPMTKEFKFAAYCVTEPQAGSDVQGIKTTVRKIGDDFVLKGSKMWITNGSVADWYFVVAYTDPAQRHKGMSAFLVPHDTPGVEVGKKEQNLGQRASDTRAITFNDVKVPKTNLVGQEGKGFFLAMTALTALRHYSGVVIASTFVVTIVVTSFISRWLRSTELRFEGFTFSDEATRIVLESVARYDSSYGNARPLGSAKS